MLTLNHLQDLVQELEKTSSSNNKKEILTTYFKKEPQLIPLIRLIYDPYIKFNLKHETAMKKGKVCDVFFSIHLLASKSYTEKDLKVNIYSILENLNKRICTGNDALNIWKSYVLSFPSNLHDLLGKILNKDLKCRTGLKLVNEALKRVNEDPIWKHEVALAKTWDGREFWKDKEAWYASRKLDGVRCSTHIEKGRALSLSRYGIPLLNFKALEKELLKYEGAPITIDGELALRTKDGKDDFQGLMELLRKKDCQVDNAVFHVFDVTFDKEPDLKFSNRRKKFKSKIYPLFDCGIIKKVKQIKIKSKEHLDKLLEKADKNGWEGLIVRKNDIWKSGKTNDILKLKKFKDLEAKVISIETGKMNIVEDGEEKTINSMKRAVILYKGNEVGIGSGWSVKQRKRFYKNPKEIIGKVITVQYQEETKNKKGEYSLRFPTVKCIHGKERTL